MSSQGLQIKESQECQLHELQSQKQSMSSDNLSNHKNEGETKKATIMDKNISFSKQESNPFNLMQQASKEEQTLVGNPVLNTDNLQFIVNENIITGVNDNINQQDQLEPTVIQLEENQSVQNQENQSVQNQEKQSQQEPLDVESQEKQVQKESQPLIQNNKRLKNILIVAVVCACLLVIGLSLYFGLNKDKIDEDEELEKSEFVVQRKFITDKQQNYKLELITTHNSQYNDTTQYSREIVMEYLFCMLIKNKTQDQIQILAFVDQTKQYEVGNQSSTVILSGARNFFDQRDLTQNQQNSNDNQKPNSVPNNNNTNSGVDDFPISQEGIDMSRAEIIQFNVSRGGEIIDIAFPMNVNETFLFNLPSFLQTLLPNIVKSNYDVVDSKGRLKFIKQTNFTQKNINGKYQMKTMKSQKSLNGDITLVQQFTQKTDQDYQSKIQQASNITFNKEGYLVQGTVETGQKFSYDDSTEDILKNQSIKQKFNVTFINETTTSAEERKNIDNIYYSMNKYHLNWTNYLKFLDDLRKSDMQLDPDQLLYDKNEKPLIDINQKVNLSPPQTRMLSENNKLLDNLQVELFSKNILTIQMKSFVAFQCSRQKDSNSNDECQRLNIPVSPIQNINFPLTKFKNEVNWIKKNSLLIVSKVKIDVFDIINKINSEIDKKIKFAQQQFTAFSNPILDDIQKYATTMTSQISGQLVDVLQILQMEYDEIVNQTLNKVNSIQSQTSQVIQSYLSNLQNNLTSIQQRINQQNQEIVQIYKNSAILNLAAGRQAIYNLEQMLQQSYQLIQNTINTQIQQNVTRFVQNQQDLIIKNTLAYLNIESSKLINLQNQLSSSMWKQVIQLAQNSFSNIFSNQFKQISTQISNQLQKPYNDLQLEFNKAKSQINLTLVQASQIASKPLNEIIPQDLQDLINKKQNQLQAMYNEFNQLTNLDQLQAVAEQNINQLTNTINLQITTKIAKITDIFQNITQQSILKFKEPITILKNKAFQFSTTVMQRILDGVDNLFDTVDTFDKKINESADQALNMLSADFNQQNFVDSVKKQMGNQAQILTDDISDVSMKSLNLPNLEDGNLLDFPVKSFINGISDFINDGTETIRKTVDTVKDVQNSLNDLSNQFNQIPQIALNFSQFESQFLNLRKDFKDIVNQVDLSNLFQMIAEDFKNDMIKYLKSEIVDNIQKQAIDQLKNKFINLGNTILKANLNKVISKLGNVNKLFETAITKISSKFQIKEEKKILFNENQRFPKYQQPYYIPTPIGIPLVLSYYFQFGAQIYTYIDIQGTSINAGFGISANADFVASAALSVLIAEVGAYAQGTIVAVDLQALLRIQLIEKQNLSFVVDATFKAFNLKASIYIQYIKIRLTQVCAFKRRVLRRFGRIGRIVRNIVQQVVKIWTCIYIPEFYKSEKEDILPVLNISGVQIQKQLVNIQLG